MSGPDIQLLFKSDSSYCGYPLQLSSLEDYPTLLSDNLQKNPQYRSAMKKDN